MQSPPLDRDPDTGNANCGDSNASHSRKRSRPSRTVADLTNDQIHRKRIVDRRAQRAARQRTRENVTQLESRFARLQETCTKQEAEIASLREQNNKFKQCMESIQSIVSGNLNVTGPTTLAVGPQEELTYSGDNAVPQTDPNFSATRTTLERTSLSPGHHDPATTPSVESRRDINTDSTPSAENDLSLVLSSGSQPPPNVSDGLRAIPLTVPDALSTSSSMIEVVGGRETGPKAAFNTLPIFLPATQPLDQILLDFITSRRDAVSRSPDPQVPSYPSQPQVQALIDTDLIHTVDSLSAIMSRVLSTFHHVKLPEKLAFFHLMYRTAVWLIQPTKEHYLSLPTWLRPTVTQVTVPHAIWISNIPWPSVRDLLAENPDEYPFELFSELYSHNVTVNWPHDPFDSISVNGSTKTLHSIFEKHIQNIGNWTASSDFEDRFPSIISTAYPNR